MDLGKVFILGDSYSTFDKWIPEGYASWYFNAAREETNVDNVDQTWWKIVLDSTESELVLNCSWSGTTVCNTGYSGDCSETSFIGRFEKLVDNGFFKENPIDTFFIFGGTNDSWSNAPLGELMFDDISVEDRFCVLPGFCYLFKRIKEILPNARIINIVNTDIKPEIISGASKAAEELGIENIVLSNINKTAGHPNKTGMSEIAQQVLTVIGEQKMIIKQISSLEKVRPSDNIEGLKAIDKKILLKGESFSYQIALFSKENKEVDIKVISSLKDNIKLYEVQNAIADYPSFDYHDDEDYITKTPQLIPDILMPLDIDKANVRVSGYPLSVWVTVDVTESVEAGEYDITIEFLSGEEKETVSFNADIIDVTLPEQKTIFTQWFHVDSIADIHNVSIYSEEHWELIDKYMAMASSLGINMILTPVITPPLDTAVGTSRPCTQLVKIKKCGDEYTFDFSLLSRWIELCLKNGIKYFEISHLFSQWGLECAPNIWVEENGKLVHMFGWHIASNAPEYKAFLESFVPALIVFLKESGIKDRCYFHISDEPNIAHIERYKQAQNIIKPLIEDCLIMDAISEYEFYSTGIMDLPVTATDCIEKFIENNVSDQWAYYCCGQGVNVGNRFLAMPSYRNRILGLQIYKFDVKGFLQWGYNFYYSQLSRKLVNPYTTTSSDMAFPSGDPFSVYPVKNGVVPSLRAIIFKEALQDVEICRVLESIIGREEVIKMIDSSANMDVRFAEYPRNNDYIPELIEKMKNMIKEKA